MSSIYVGRGGGGGGGVEVVGLAVCGRGDKDTCQERGKNGKRINLEMKSS